MPQQQPKTGVPIADENGQPTRPWIGFFNSLSIPPPTTFANLPAKPTQGSLRIITDSATAAWGATVSGGSTNTVLAWFNGTVFTVIGK